MKQRLSLTELNSAATLWSTAAVGVLAGAWMWREAIDGATIIPAANGFLHPLAVSWTAGICVSGGKRGPPNTS